MTSALRMALGVLAWGLFLIALLEIPTMTIAVAIAFLPAVLAGLFALERWLEGRARIRRRLNWQRSRSN